MTPARRHTSVTVFQSLLLLTTCLSARHCTLLEVVDAIASFDNASGTSGTNVCIFTTPNSTLDTIAPSLLRTLLSKYPTTFLSLDGYFDTMEARLASVVLLDLTAYHYEFPIMFIKKRLSKHPCYKKTAKFVIVMGGTSFERKEAALLCMKKFAILNYVLIAVSSAVQSTGVVTLYTENQFTGAEYYFRSTDRPVQQFFPDKLRDLYGFRFKMFADTYYPYVLLGHNGSDAVGLLPYFVRSVIEERHNGSAHFSANKKVRPIMHANFRSQEFRNSFMHTIFFWEQTGICLLCPVRTVRDFLGHLLKPFSLGIWSILGGVFVFCRVLEILFPELYRYDMIAITFFGGGGVEYEQPFAFRLVTLTLAVLVFFLSEAYNTKIISLMALAKYYEQPQTFEEMANSDYRILSTPMMADIFGNLTDRFLPFSESRREERRLGYRVVEHYCLMLHLEQAWLVVAERKIELDTPLYAMRDLLMVDRHVIQLAQQSPFFGLFQRMFILFHDSGLWAYLLERTKETVDRYHDALIDTPYQEVVFFYDDLFCVWVLIIVGRLLAPITSNCNLWPAIDTIVRLQRHRYLPNANAEVCIVAFNTSTLAETHPAIVPSLISQYPVQFATDNQIKALLLRKHSNVVLLDASGSETFPAADLVELFTTSPCHYIDARFIVLVTQVCFWKHRSEIVKFFDQQGIVNYAVVPLPARALDPMDDVSIYTENRFSKEQIFVRLDDLDKLHRLFPNKLSNLHRYHINIGVANDFPYIIAFGPDQAGGVLSYFFYDVGRKVLNLSYTFFHQTTNRHDVGANFDLTDFRQHFQHEIALREMGGMCMMCPVKTDRDFLAHLIKPFSIGIWVILWGVFVACWCVRRRFPDVFRHDLILLTFFGGGGHEYQQAFVLRLVLLTLALLVFFLSEAYNTKIISLMSLSKFYERPETMAEFRQSDYRIVLSSHARTKEVIGDLHHKVLGPRETGQITRRLGVRMYQYYCTIMTCGDAMMIVASEFEDTNFQLYVLREKAVEAPHIIQLAINSPLFGVLKRYFGLYCDTGLWEHHKRRTMGVMAVLEVMKNKISSVIFYHDDLLCVWILVVVGWTISLAIFIGELVWFRWGNKESIKPIDLQVRNGW